MNFMPQLTLSASDARAIHLQASLIAIRRGERPPGATDGTMGDNGDDRKLWTSLLRFAVRSVGPANPTLLETVSELASGKRARGRASAIDPNFVETFLDDLGASSLSGLCHRAFVVTRALQDGTLDCSSVPSLLASELLETWHAARPIRLSNGMLVVSPSGRRHLPDLWLSQGHDPSTVSLAIKCLSRSGDLTAVFLPWATRRLAGPLKRVISLTVPAEDIHGFRSYGLNGQTNAGRASLALYLANSKAMQAVIPRTRSPKRAVWIASQIVKRVETDPIVEELIPTEHVELTDLVADTINGLDRHRARQARAILTDEIGLLNACRREVLSHVR